MSFQLPIKKRVPSTSEEKEVMPPPIETVSHWCSIEGCGGTPVEQDPNFEAWFNSIWPGIPKNNATNEQHILALALTYNKVLGFYQVKKG